ncbi:MAG: hypothetical protein QNK05_00120 [Myxococcota bacterium]|nr:hypothetical protein [Myxococcota bacterium]
MKSELAFDQVAIRMGSGHNLLAAAEWLGLPVGEQFELISGARVEFLLEGEPVPTRDALRSMASR